VRFSFAVFAAVERNGGLLISSIRVHCAKLHSFRLGIGSSSTAMTGVSKVRVLIVEDYIPFQRFISAILSKKRNLQIICEVADGLEAVKKAEELKPDLILLDVGLPTLDGIAAARLIRKLAPKSKIIFVTTESSADVAQEALNSGAWGYVVKAMAGADLLAALEVVSSGRQFASSTLGDLHFHLDASQAPDLPTVTPVLS